MPDSSDLGKSQDSSCRRLVEIDVVRPLGDEQAPGAGDDLGDGPDEDEKLAPLDLLLVLECPVFRNFPADEPPARLPSPVPASAPSMPPSSAAAMGPATTTRPIPGKTRNAAPMHRPNSHPNNAPVSAPALT